MLVCSSAKEGDHRRWRALHDSVAIPTQSLGIFSCCGLLFGHTTTRVTQPPSVSRYLEYYLGGLPVLPSTIRLRHPLFIIRVCNLMREQGLANSLTCLNSYSGIDLPEYFTDNIQWGNGEIERERERERARERGRETERERERERESDDMIRSNGFLRRVAEFQTHLD